MEATREEGAPDDGSTRVAVIAHRKKLLGGGLVDLRRMLARHGFNDPLWFEVTKSRQASKAARQARDAGAELIFIWGGDGTVQRCVDALAGEPVVLAVLPAGTANLLATNLGVPATLRGALEVGLFGDRRVLDVGVLGGKHFTFMAGVGLDAVMMQRADGKLKERFGHFAYVWTGLRAARMDPFHAKVTIDGVEWFDGKASCVLLGQMGTLAGGLVAFPDASPDDGLLEVGVITARGALQWARVALHLVLGHPDRSPLTEMTRGSDISIDLDRPIAFELDGGARKARQTLHATIRPGAITVAVPHVVALAAPVHTSKTPATLSRAQGWLVRQARRRGRRHE